jgi:hypothetical protein
VIHIAIDPAGMTTTVQIPANSRGLVKRRWPRVLRLRVGHDRPRRKAPRSARHPCTWATLNAPSRRRRSGGRRGLERIASQEPRGDSAASEADPVRWSHLADLTLTCTADCATLRATAAPTPNPDGSTPAGSLDRGKRGVDSSGWIVVCSQRRVAEGRGRSGTARGTKR